MKKEVLIILHPDFEEIEAVTPIDILRRAGIVVHIASTSNDLDVQSKSGIQIKADSLLSDHEHGIYDALVIPGGPGIFKISDHSMIQKKIREFHKLKKCIACICAAPLLCAASRRRMQGPRHVPGRSHLQYSTCYYHHSDSFEQNRTAAYQ